MLYPQGIQNYPAEFQKICVTNRALCKEDFLVRIEKIAKASPAGIILREKDLMEKEYRELAEQIMVICDKYQVPCILHSFVNVAIDLKAEAIHLPLPLLRKLRRQELLYSQEEVNNQEIANGWELSAGRGQAEFARDKINGYGWQTAFRQIGASCHSVEDAVEAQELGCTYITAGHIFATDCKKGVPPRGLEFLRSVCESVDIPVYAIGGVNEKNIDSVRSVGAHGACIMSGLMCCEDVSEYMDKL